jgi:predicted PurR-regulated permease PerM
MMMMIIIILIMIIIITITTTIIAIIIKQTPSAIQYCPTQTLQLVESINVVLSHKLTYYRPS